MKKKRRPTYNEEVINKVEVIVYYSLPLIKDDAVSHNHAIRFQIAGHEPRDEA